MAPKKSCSEHSRRKVASQSCGATASRHSPRQPGRQPIDRSGRRWRPVRFHARPRSGSMPYMHKLSCRLSLLKDVAWALPVLGLLSCQLPERRTGPSTSEPLARLAVFPQSALMRVDQTKDVTVVGFTAAGDTAAIAVTFHVRGTAGGALTGITNSGRGRAIAHYRAGFATGLDSVIAADTSGISNMAIVDVTQMLVSSTTVTPPAATILVGLTAAFSATTRDSTGAILTGRVITWRSTATGIATVNASGVAMGVSAGSASIIATSEGKSDTSAVTVTAVPVASVTVTPATASVGVGGTTPFTATTRDSAGTILTGRVITWASTTPAVATVNGSGVASGVAPGSASIIATSEGKSDTSVVTVIVVPVASVTVTHASTSVAVGGTVSFSAVKRDSAGGVLTGRVITWASDALAVATVSPTGVATGVSAGSASIIATSEGKADTSVLTVTPPPPPGSLADPTLLPRATGQHPAAGTYGRTLAAGQTYVDPTTGTTVLKLTDATVPTANTGMYHGYAEGGPNISQPWVGTDGQTYYTAKVSDWLVDIRYSTFTPLNWRPISYRGEIGFAFSMNPATPRIAYVVNGKQVNRYNTATNAIENTGHWPWIIAAAGDSPDWLQTQMNDTWLVGMLQTNHTIIAFRPSDGFERSVTEAAAAATIDEPHLDREFPYLYISTTTG